ncbi:hypothetical protein BDD12DRAFT_270296 [Trichophaea hybrida]|nr:hypothetical protein BDD12DRAFT_270296 [Trichophaea hybrida]
MKGGLLSGLLHWMPRISLKTPLILSCRVVLQTAECYSKRFRTPASGGMRFSSANTQLPGCNSNTEYGSPSLWRMRFADEKGNCKYLLGIGDIFLRDDYLCG